MIHPSITNTLPNLTKRFLQFFTKYASTMANTKGPHGNISLNFHEPVKTSVNTGEDKKMYKDIALNKSILLDIYNVRVYDI